MKNLTSCSPREFLRQTAKIRHAVKEWLTLTDIMNIRKRLPDIPADATKEEQDKMIALQAKENVQAMLDAIMDEHPDETADLLALCCFTDPEHADEHTMPEYLGAFSDMMNNEEVWRFFTSLVRLARTSGLMA